VENSHPSDIKTKSLEKYLIHTLDCTAINFSFLDNDQWSLTDNLQKAHIFIQSFNDRISLKFDLNGHYKTYNISPKNLPLTLNKIHYILRTQNAKSSTPVKNVAHINNLKSIWSERHFDFKKLNEYFFKSKDIQSFMLGLFQIPHISSFTVIHLFIHEKGSVEANHIRLTRDNSSEKQQSVQEFTLLFQAIKKSKNHSFGQSTLKASNFSIIGTCLAQEFSFKNDNLILLLSREDFLPQQEKHILFFKRFVKTLEPYLRLTLARIYNQKYAKLYFKLFNTIRELIQHDQSSSELQADFFIQNIETLLTQIQNKSFSIGDVHHHERIILLGELLNTLRHELSNPLFGLQLTTELLKLDPLNDDQAMFVDEIYNAICRSQKIIQNFSQIYSDNSEFDGVNIIYLLHEVIILTKSESKSIPKKVFYNDTLVDTKKLDITINTNKTWLAQIFFNLIINSTQALNSSGQIKPQISISISSSKDGHINLLFLDNGPGLNGSSQNQMFDPFYTTKKEGTGLGLSISKSLAHKLNGTLEYIASDNGAQFLLRLPYENPHC
jgi:two-component system, NtrC family, sensor kinase